MVKNLKLFNDEALLKVCGGNKGDDNSIQRYQVGDFVQVFSDKVIQKMTFDAVIKEVRYNAQENCYEYYLVMEDREVGRFNDGWYKNSDINNKCRM